MSRFIVKICGLTSVEDVEMVVRAGADAVGVNFWEGSKRFVGDAAGDVLAAVPAGVLKVGVFVNASAGAVRDCAHRFGLDRVQLHGDERAQDFAALPADTVVRAIRVRNAASLAEAEGWHADLFLYDAFVDGYGGGGTPAPWADIAAARMTRPFLLAGGLTANNVSAAIHATRPAGVDVASGVESAPGRKDRGRVEAFIRAARAAAAAIGP
ncbi:MAG: phosphoribosylanthranilate isomerase [Pseudomonadota bacterium]